MRPRTDPLMFGQVSNGVINGRRGLTAGSPLHPHERTSSGRHGMSEKRRPQPNPLAVALDDQAITVVLDFVDPLGAVGDLRRLGRNARFEWGFQHSRLDSRRLQVSLGALVTLGPRQRLGLLQGFLAGEQLGPQAPTGNIIEIKEHGLPAIGKPNLNGSAAGQGFVFANLDARGHAGTQVVSDVAASH